MKIWFPNHSFSEVRTEFVTSPAALSLRQMLERKAGGMLL
jgi:hypothetical protein